MNKEGQIVKLQEHNKSQRDRQQIRALKIGIQITTT